MRWPVDSLETLWSLRRATRLGPVLVSSLMGVAIVAVPVALEQQFRLLDVTLILHLGMLTMLVGAGFVLDDPADNTTAVTPLGPGRVAAVRLGMASVVLALSWSSQLALAPRLVSVGQSVPQLSLGIEAPAMATWIWAVAALAGSARERNAAGGAVAAPFTIISGVAIALLPDRVALFVNPTDDGFDDSRVRWIIVLVTGAVALALSVQRLASGRRSRPHLLRLLQRSTRPGAGL